ncbi:nucleotidyl transferase AbiEii/AbiGii toxin family protein [Agromyces sp. H3Y2-19a]|uniref:nucleotidyl transferase AbiEii/AbiGii toxin family protein n=1 Tax=Agromyces chromiiresistens TaxID=3030835 RepID=UPI0023B955AA|nr:nucleotidyl transferase AbiEii/AbiGii toxin family protein [Agromyces chromiiresistens]MDF0512491.1 nucleotidyl transferase AbiEii/AbiGii toxin family protein [Agromyces chromiiresistens]
MTGTEPYASPSAVEAAIKSAARKAFGADPSLTIQERIRLEYFHRFLSRVFSEAEDSDWMLKGGTSMLARVGSARSTTDVDLFRRSRTLDAALEDLRRLAAIDLGDFFRFDYAGHSNAVDGNQQAYAEGYQVSFDVSIGAKKKDSFHVDLVVNVTMTDEVEIARPANALELPKLPSNPYRLYPVVDQIADKVCATMADYNGRPSSREKDLVDLVVFATTQTVNADALQRAIRVEARVRSLPSFTELAIPMAWGRVYSKEAKKVPYCADYRTVDLARDLMRVFIDPVLLGEASGRTWSPKSLAWSEPPGPPQPDLVPLMCH